MVFLALISFWILFQDGEGRDALIADIAKTSVKELMEEEMMSEQEQNQQISADIQTKESVSESRGYVKRTAREQIKVLQLLVIYMMSWMLLEISDLKTVFIKIQRRKQVLM